MPTTRTQKLDVLRRWLEAIDALRGLLDDADKAERFLAESQGAIENATQRVAAAKQDTESLERRRGTLASEVDRDRERLLTPVMAERQRLVGESETLTAKIAADRKAFEEEVGRRTSILRTLEEQVQTAQREHRARLRAQQDEAETDKARLRGIIEELKAREVITRGELEKAKAEYQSVLDAASRLVRRA